MDKQRKLQHTGEPQILAISIILIDIDYTIRYIATTSSAPALYSWLSTLFANPFFHLTKLAPTQYRIIARAGSSLSPYLHNKYITFTKQHSAHTAAATRDLYTQYLLGDERGRSRKREGEHCRGQVHLPERRRPESLDGRNPHRLRTKKLSVLVGRAPFLLGTASSPIREPVNSELQSLTDYNSDYLEDEKPVYSITDPLPGDDRPDYLASQKSYQEFFQWKGDTPTNYLRQNNRNIAIAKSRSDAELAKRMHFLDVSGPSVPQSHALERIFDDPEKRKVVADYEVPVNSVGRKGKGKSVGIGRHVRDQVVGVYRGATRGAGYLEEDSEEGKEEKNDLERDDGGEVEGRDFIKCEEIEPVVRPPSSPFWVPMNHSKKKKNKEKLTGWKGTPYGYGELKVAWDQLGMEHHRSRLGAYQWGKKSIKEDRMQEERWKRELGLQMDRELEEKKKMKTLVQPLFPGNPGGDIFLPKRRQRAGDLDADGPGSPTIPDELRLLAECNRELDSERDTDPGSLGSRVTSYTEGFTEWSESVGDDESMVVEGLVDEQTETETVIRKRMVWVRRNDKGVGDKEEEGKLATISETPKKVMAGVEGKKKEELFEGKRYLICNRNSKLYLNIFTFPNLTQVSQPFLLLRYPPTKPVNPSPINASTLITLSTVIDENLKLPESLRSLNPNMPENLVNMALFLKNGHLFCGRLGEVGAIGHSAALRMGDFASGKVHSVSYEDGNFEIAYQNVPGTLGQWEFLEANEFGNLISDLAETEWKLCERQENLKRPGGIRG